MNNIGTLYKFEIKKILCRKLTIIVLIAVSLLMIAMNMGEYFAGSKTINTDEQILSGRKVDDVMLEEMRQAIEPKTVSTEDGTQTIIGFGIKNRAYQPLCNYLTTIGGNCDKAYNMTEAELEKRFNGCIEEQMREQHLTEAEVKYWNERQKANPMPLTYGKIQNGWGDSVCIIYVVAILCMIAIAATLSGIFSDEIGFKTDALIFSSRNGKKKLVTAKLLAGITVGMLETFILLIVCVGTEFALSGFVGGDTDVRFFVGPSAMNMTIQKAFWVYVGIMLVIGLLMSLFAMCLSQLCKNSVAVIAIMMGFWLISMLNPPYSMRIVSQAASFLPVTFLGSWTFSDYRMIGLFGHMFNILQIAPMLYLILSVIFAKITRISYNKYQVER